MYTKGVIDEPIHADTLGLPVVSVIVLNGLTVMVPEEVNVPQPPVRLMVYVKDPATEGVPVMSTLLFDQMAVTPEGNPVADIPVAPVVVNAMVSIGVFKQTVCKVVPDAEVNVIVFKRVVVMDAVTGLTVVTAQLTPE